MIDTMDYTLKEVIIAASRVRQRYYPDCWRSQRDIEECGDLDQFRRLVMKYRQEICAPQCAEYIVRHYAGLLDYVGLRVQFFVDRRARFYLA